MILQTLSYIALFVAIQLISLVLTVVGIPLIAMMSALRLWHTQPNGITAWNGKLLWLWSNDEDGIFGPNAPHTRWRAFYWAALRNPCHNFGLIPGVSGKGRPLWLKNFTVRGVLYYAQAGWYNNGRPVLSAGKGAY